MEGVSDQHSRRNILALQNQEIIEEKPNLRWLGLNVAYVNEDEIDGNVADVGSVFLGSFLASLICL